MVEQLQDQILYLKTPEGLRDAIRTQLGYLQPNERRLPMMDIPALSATLPERWPYTLVSGALIVRTIEVADRRAKGVVLETAPERMPLVCFMNMRKPPFDDVRIRKAIGGYGLNRKQIAQTVFQNRATPLVSILPAQLFAYHLTLAKGLDAARPRGIRKVTETR